VSLSTSYIYGRGSGTKECRRHNQLVLDVKLHKIYSCE